MKILKYFNLEESMEEIDLKELISIFMKRKALIILVVIIFALIGAIYTLKFITPTYKSNTNLILVQTGADKNVLGDSSSITASDLTLNSKLVNNYKEIATSESVLAKVIQNLNLDMSYVDLKTITTVAITTETEILHITVEYTDPEIACKIAGEIANVFIEKVNQLYKLDNLHILDQANVNPIPSNIHLGKNIIIFAFIGGILVTGYILLINMLDTTVKTDTDIERILDVPVLASIVLTNEAAKKNVQKQADNLYKMSGFDTNEDPTLIESESVFENYNEENNSSLESGKREDDSDKEDYINENYSGRSRKNKRNKSKNRRNV